MSLVGTNKRFVKPAITDPRTPQEKYGSGMSTGVLVEECFAPEDKGGEGKVVITKCYGQGVPTAANCPVKHPAIFYAFETATGSKAYLSYGTVGETVSGWDAQA